MAEKLCFNESTIGGIRNSIKSRECNEKYFKLPNNLREARDLARGGELNRGMEMVGNSLKAHRSCNEAIIFVYGVSGAGKTASLNHLFGFDIIRISDEKASDTKLVTEYVATMESDDWRVSNLQIGFIDMPGWNDSRGEEQDILNMATIDQFISNHPYLGSIAYKCYPSIVMVAIKANDNRIVGENSQVVRMFRALTKLKIIDKVRPNLLIILTHVVDVGKRRFKDNLNNLIIIVKELAKSYLDIEPVITYVENKYEENELEVKGDWTILRDGTLQPRNVFEAMMQLTDKHKDEVGHEAIRLYFTSKGNNKPITKRQSVPGTLNELEIKKWRSILAQEFANAPRNEVSQALQTYAHSHPDICTERSLVTLMIELNARLLTQLVCLHSMTLNQVQERLVPYQLSQIENQSLVEGCGVKPYEFPNIIHTIGYGMNAETGELTHSPTLVLSSEWYVQRGVKLPKSMQVVKPKEKRRVEWKRLSESHSSLDKLAGQTLTSPSTEIPVKYQFQIIYSIYTVKLILSDHQLLVSQLSPGFKEAVTALPESSIAEGNQVRREYVDFFNMYGHWVLVGCECGGCVEGELEMEEREAMYIQEHISLYINNLIERLESGDDSAALPLASGDINEAEQMFESIGRQVLNWRGGDYPGQITLTAITPQMWQQWTTSLYEKPITLDVFGSNNPKQLQIYQLVSLVDSHRSIQVEVASKGFVRDTVFEVILETSLQDGISTEIHTPPSMIEYTGDTHLRRETISSVYRSVTLDKSPGGFPENATIIQGEPLNSYTNEIRQIELGDTILCIDPWEIKYSKVVKVNSSEEEKELEYLHIEHEYGELLIGGNHTIKQVKGFPNKESMMALASDLRKGDVILYMDKKQNKCLHSKILSVGTKVGKGHYSLKVKHEFADILVDQVVTGDEEPACFPGNASVMLRGGERVRMDELEIGDYVLSIHPTTGKPVYSRVYLWAHRDTHITATFLHITHPHGHLHISANHLILNGDQRRPVPADQLRVGDSIHFLSPCLSQQQQQQLDGKDEEERGDSHTLISVPVLHVHTCTQVGYYAPFTNNGLIVVDGIATSVYSHLSTHSQSDSSSSSSSWLWSGVFHSVTSGLVHKFGMHRVGHCVLTPVRVGCKLGMASVLSRQMDTNTHIHKYCQWFLKLCRNV